ncbi:Site-specific recombinase XerC [Klenkia soli]|uniref:Site-specific recombinase XerC n=2 Tax=Klenkia soli TaxID=1052260 RepID=A0A1H0G9B9_9ACTN|nr:Site-specific recombinase XerC [Klenkia soli]
MRATLLAQGFSAADIDGMLGAPRQAVNTIRTAVADATAAMRRELPASLKTWGPYLQVLVDGLPDLCPCPCTTCSTGACPCAAGQHADTCTVPDDHRDLACSDRYRGAADLDVTAVTRQTIAEGAWWLQRRGLKRTVARNAARLATGRQLLHADGRGAHEQFIQACRWMFTWLVDENRTSANPALKVKLLPRQEAAARSLSTEEFMEVYDVAVSTGQDAILDGLILRHLVIQGVRRGALLGLTCGGLEVESRQIGYWDQKKKTWRKRPTTSTHMADLLGHAVARGPRVAAPAGATEVERRHGIPNLTDADPVFYGRPEDTFDAEGNFVSRTVHPITRKRIERLFTRVRRHLPWTERVELRPHDIRHTSARIIYRAADQQMAKLHLAHDGGSTTDHYLKERLDELAKLKEQLFEPGAGPDEAAR